MKKNILLLMILFMLVRNVSSRAVGMDDDDGMNEVAAENTERRDGIRALPRAGLLVEWEKVFENDAGYSMQVRRAAEIELMRYGIFFSAFNIEELHIFRGENPEWHDPYSIRYNIDFIHFGWDFRYGTIGFFMDHRCANIVNRADTDPMQLRWYGYGLRVNSRGMKIGQKNASPNGSAFQFLNSLNYLLSFSRALGTEKFDYKMMMIGALRYDPFRLYGITPYLEGGFMAVRGDGRFFIDRYAESGLRFRITGADITAYGKYQFLHDIDVCDGTDAPFWFMGMRVESLFDAGPVSAPPAGTGFVKGPDMHLKGSYGRYVSSGNLSYHADATFEITLLSVGDFSLFANSTFDHDSKKGGNAMYPRFITYSAEPGLNYFWDLAGLNIELFYRYERRDNGNFYRGYREIYQEAGLRLMSDGMKTGRLNRGISLPGTTALAWVNRWNWKLSAARIVHDTGYPYTWDGDASLRWDLFRLFGMILYSEGTAGALYRDGYETEYSLEGGIRFCGGFNVMLYYRYAKKIDIDMVGGLRERNQSAGIRADI